MLNDKHDLFDGFTVQLIAEDGEWLARLAEVPTVSAYGETGEEAFKELGEAWRLMKESYESRGLPIPIAPSKKTYSGSFNVRIGKQLHRDLAVEAAQVGVSLNALVSQKLIMGSEHHQRSQR